MAQGRVKSRSSDRTQNGCPEKSIQKAEANKEQVRKTEAKINDSVPPPVLKVHYWRGARSTASPPPFNAVIPEDHYLSPSH